MKTYIINAAGGNATAIQVLEQPKSKAEYENIGRQLISDNEDKQVEQAGFLISPLDHFEMSGGEFCGNAARAVAILFSQEKNEEKVSFTMSGFKGIVSGLVKTIDESYYDVTCNFPGMMIKKIPVNIGKPATLVDLGGIVHVVIEEDFPFDNYTEIHKAITKKLQLSQRDAVGVVWVKKFDGQVKIDPVVWVRGIDSFFYETSCGSGSIAAASVLDIQRIIQPTGEEIFVNVKKNEVIIRSKMEVIDETES